MWLLECQAEGDRLLRIDVRDRLGRTAEPTHGRRAAGCPGKTPSRPRASTNSRTRTAPASSATRSPGRSTIDLDDPDRAHLTYLRVGQRPSRSAAVADHQRRGRTSGVERLSGPARCRPRLRVSAVGEWNKLFCRQVALWTSDPRLNRMFQDGQLAALRGLPNGLRTGMAATDRVVVHTARIDRHLRHAGTSPKPQSVSPICAGWPKTHGRAYPGNDSVAAARNNLPIPARQIVETTVAYITALGRHLHHHFDARSLNAHRTGSHRCADMLIAERVGAGLEHSGQTARSRTGAEVCCISGRDSRLAMSTPSAGRVRLDCSAPTTDRCPTRTQGGFLTLWRRQPAPTPVNRTGLMTPAHAVLHRRWNLLEAVRAAAQTRRILLDSTARGCGQPLVGVAQPAATNMTANSAWFGTAISFTRRARSRATCRLRFTMPFTHCMQTSTNSTYNLSLSIIWTASHSVLVFIRSS